MLAQTRLDFDGGHREAKPVLARIEQVAVLVVLEKYLALYPFLQQIRLVTHSVIFLP